MLVMASYTAQGQHHCWAQTGCVGLELDQHHGHDLVHVVPGQAHQYAPRLLLNLRGGRDHLLHERGDDVAESSSVPDIPSVQVVAGSDGGHDDLESLHHHDRAAGHVDSGGVPPPGGAGCLPHSPPPLPGEC